jgi:hypothetical protein
MIDIQGDEKNYQQTTREQSTNGSISSLRARDFWRTPTRLSQSHTIGEIACHRLEFKSRFVSLV